jgi:hypothetical protein
MKMANLHLIFIFLIVWYEGNDNVKMLEELAILEILDVESSSRKPAQNIIGGFVNRDIKSERSDLDESKIMFSHKPTVRCLDDAVGL